MFDGRIVTDRCDDDDFYEKIEAPKFVDFTAPERRVPDEDRYWFCMRVGCDRKHEEEIDHEQIYKNFVLRVMAARSPNVRLRRAQAIKPSLNCPRTAHPNSHAPRPPISRTIVGAARPQGAPNVKSNTRPIQSVRKPKPTDAEPQKHNAVAKTLVYRPPNKESRAKASPKKPETARQRKRTSVYGTALPPDASLGGGEVKTRVVNSMHCSGEGDESLICASGAWEEDCSDMEIDEESMDVKTLDTCKSNAENECAESLMDSKTSKLEREGRIGDDLNENENDNESTIESDDKENVSSPESKRERVHQNQESPKTKILGKHKDSKSINKVPQVSSKTIKDSASVSAGSSARVIKYRKPTPTNPKPFRLRTNERQILKEANKERKLNHLLPKEIVTVARVSKRKQRDGHEGSEKGSERRTKVDRDRDQPTKTTTIVDSRQEQCQHKPTEKEAKTTKPPLMKQPTTPQRLSKVVKKKPTLDKPSGQLTATHETSLTMSKHTTTTVKTREKYATTTAKASAPKPSNHYVIGKCMYQDSNQQPYSYR